MWEFDLSNIPKNTPFLVFLEEESCGNRVHAAINMKTANGYLMIVGCHFAYDMPRILAWHPMIKLPGK